jgi:protein TonB
VCNIIHSIRIYAWHGIRNDQTGAIPIISLKINFMQTRTVYKLAGSLVISAFCLFGMDACSNDSGYVSSDSNAAAVDSTANAKVAADSAAAATATTAKTPAKKRKTSITMPMGNNDQMVKDKEGVYNNAEVMPQFPGGSDALASYVNDHLQYTQTALDASTTGTVKVSFVVDEKGKIMNAHLIGGNKVGNGLDEEALRVVNAMPSWKPGKVKGKNVKTRLELPISFQLEA